MAKVWTTDFHKPQFHTLLKPDCDESYGHKCTCCDSPRTRVVDKASRRGWLIKCDECGAMYYVQEQK